MTNLTQRGPGFMTLRRMSIRLLLTATFLGSNLLIPAGVSAKSISLEEAAVIAKDFFASKSNSAKGALAPEVVKLTSKTTAKHSSKVQSEDTAQPYYLFNDASGFVIVSGDDDRNPIVGYSLDSKLESDNLPPQLEWFLESYENTVKAGGVTLTSDFVATPVAPIMKTKWNQDLPYNNLCPKYPGDEYPAPTGCVATAVAQVMKVHNFPPQGKGAVAYKEGSWNGYNVDLNHVYDWENMIDDYESVEYTQVQADAVSRLMHDVGAAVCMDYGREQSGAPHQAVLPGLFRHFNYSKDMQMLFRDTYKSSEWMSMIQDNLMKGWPIVYSGSSASSGHEFVLDGIDNNGYVHVNWGWGGMADGYFDINSLEPYSTGIGGGDGSYNKNQAMLINIHPGDADADNTQYPGMLYFYNFKAMATTDDDGWVDGMRMSMYFDFANLTDKDLKARTIKLTFSLLDKDKNVIDPNFLSGTQGNLGQHYYATERYPQAADPLMANTCDFTNVADGEYYLCLNNQFEYLGYYANEESGYKQDIFYASDPYYPVIKYDGKLLLPREAKEYSEYSIELISLEQIAPKYNIQDSKLQMDVVFRNNGNSSLTGEAWVYVLPDNAPESFTELPAGAEHIGYISLSGIYPGASKTCSFTTPWDSKFNSMALGKHRLAFTYANKLVEMSQPVYFEITELPDNHPFVLTTNLMLNPDEVTNTNFWVGYEFGYVVNDNWRDWFYQDKTLQFWAKRRGSEDAEFLLREVDAAEMYFTSQKSYIIWDYANLLWKTPGVYDFYLKYKSGDEWVYLDAPANKGSFTVVEDKPEYDLVLSSPMIINNGNPVKTDQYFPISFTVKSNTGINFEGDNAWMSLKFTRDPSSDDNIGYGTDFTYGKKVLNPGEETTITASAYIGSYTEDVEKMKLMAMLQFTFMEGDYWKSAILNPGNYKESTFINFGNSGISDVTVDTNITVHVDGMVCIVKGMEPGDRVDIYSIDGRKCFGMDCSADSVEASLMPGVYVVNVLGNNRSYSTKIVVR